MRRCGLTDKPHGPGPSIAAFVLTVAILAPVQAMVPMRMLLPDRFWPGAGWVEIALLALYAAWLVRYLLDPRKQAVWRLRLWLLFSTVFFVQLGLGLAGVEQCLMTPSKLHYPIPALIAAGPVYRGTGLFMPVLFGVTVLLVGPAWCSHLCYFGAWDGAAARARKKPAALPGWSAWLRLAILVAVVGAAASLRWLGVAAATAGYLALGFGLLGVVIMLLASRSRGEMVHCTVYCPIGLLANGLGKLSLFRIRIKDACNDCGACAIACRYGALEEADIKRRRPGLTCTLCGDCVGKCRTQGIGYRFPGLSADHARVVFLVIAVGLHASFLGLARI